MLEVRKVENQREYLSCSSSYSLSHWERLGEGLSQTADRSQETEVRGQRSEVRGQRSEHGIFHFPFLIFYFSLEEQESGAGGQKGLFGI